MFFQLIFVGLAVAASAVENHSTAEPASVKVKFACQLSQDPGKQNCRRDGLTLSVYTTNAEPIDLEIEKAELAALIKSWIPVDVNVERPKRQLGYGGGVAGSTAQAASGSFGGGFGGGIPGVGGFPGGFGGGISNSFAASGSNAFGGGQGFGR